MSSKPGHLRMTQGQYEELADSQCGACLDCRYIQEGCEPDARNYQCDNCGCTGVFGIEECLVMGRITFVDTDTESDIQW